MLHKIGIQNGQNQFYFRLDVFYLLVTFVNNLKKIFSLKSIEIEGK